MQTLILIKHQRKFKSDKNHNEEHLKETTAIDKKIASNKGQNKRTASMGLKLSRVP